MKERKTYYKQHARDPFYMKEKPSLWLCIATVLILAAISIYLNGLPF